MAEQLTCGACGFANEPERVYCHHCGAKLDRSLLPVVEEDQSKESADAARKRIRKMTNPSGYTAKDFFKSLFWVLFWSTLVSSTVLQIRKPDGVPEDKNELPDRLVQSDLMEAIQSPAPRTISFTEADVNGALKLALKRAISGGKASMDTPHRAYAVLLPGVIRVTVMHELWSGVPMYSSADYQLSVVGGKFTTKVVGGSVGRMPFHPMLMKYSGFLFDKLWTALKREHDQMEHMQSVTITKGNITFVTKGGAR